ncbi:MAG: MgtC/SapB family protein [Solobacterium sp.]|nr:MgtC/SapB family protein [Solobacterium sp.]
MLAKIVSELYQVEWVLRLLLAATAGGMVGYERHNRSKEAGIRTHALVALGACLAMIISKYGFGEAEKFDAARVAAQVISGVSFLGAGIIFVRHDVIQGLTTAAGIWTTAAIGLCFGCGLFIIGAAATAMVIFIQKYFPRVMHTHQTRTVMTLRIQLKEHTSSDYVTTLLNSMDCHNIENRIHSDGNGGWYMKAEIYTMRGMEPEDVISGLMKNPKIVSVEII